MPGETGPTPPSERIRSLDALRGLAVLGILVINVRVFSMPEIVLRNPTAYGDFTGSNYWAWVVGHVFAQSKFITVFSALFGASTVLFLQKKRQEDRNAVGLYLRRTGVLVVIGLMHAYLLWYGDILVTYGAVGLFLLLVRDAPPKELTALGAVLLTIVPIAELGVVLTASADVTSQWGTVEAAVKQEVATYRGGWLQQMDHRAPTALRRQTGDFVGAGFWRVSGTMILGMAMYRWGVLTGERSTAVYRWLVLGGILGVGIVTAGVVYIEMYDWSAGVAVFWKQFNYWGSLLVAGGYVGAVTLYARWRPDGPLTRALSAVGRMAFTNYLLQTVVATTVFYGHGLGLFGAVSRIEALGFVGVVWVAQIIASVLWLRVFEFGPVEWIWRALTYGDTPQLRS